MIRHALPALLACSTAVPLAPGQEPFEPLEALRGSVPSPAFIEGADMNGDGLMDVVMGSGELATERVTPGEFAVSIAFGEAGGTYAPCRSIGVPSGPIRAMDIGDVDGDGDIDLAIVASRGPNTGNAVVEVWVNSGAGVFTLEDARTVPYSLLHEVEIFDVDEDGIPDLFLSGGKGDGSSLFNGAIWMRRDASGQLSAFIELVTSGFGCSRARLVDLDADGDLDIVAAGSSAIQSEFSWWENTAGFPIDFTTAEPLPFGAGSALDFVAFDADLDGDTDIAALAVNFSSTQSLHVLINDGSGALTLSPPYQSPRSGRDLIASDIDHDGDLDLVCTAIDGNSGGLIGVPTYMLNDGSGAFVGAATFGPAIVDAQALHVVDLTGDDLPEVLLAGRRTGSPFFSGLPSARVYTNSSVAAQVSFDSARELVETLGLAPLHWADFNGDGLDDLCAQSVYGGVNFAAIKLSLGDGRFGAAVRVADVAPLSVTRQGGPDAGDINGDGHADLVYLDPGVTAVHASLGDGTGAVGATILLVPWSSDADFVELHDLDEDGDLDLLGTRVNGTRLAVSFNDGSGGFSPMGSLGGGFPAALEFEYVDLNGDGERDIVTTSGSTLEWMRGQGGASFASRSAVASWPVLPKDVVSGDLDGDGALDMAMVPSGTATPIYVTFGLGDGTFGSVSTVSSTSQGWSTLRAVDFDLDGDDDLVGALGVGGLPFNGGLRVIESLENRTFGSQVPINSLGPRIAYLSSSDIDGDGDQDLLAGLEDVAALGVFKARANRSLGGVYCIGAVPNSTGQVGTMVAIGSDLPMDNRLTLRSSALPATSFGFYLASLAADYVTQVPGSEGILCLGGSIGRFVGPGQVQNSGAAGSFELSLDLTAIPQPNGLVSVTSGSTWHFQGWHRDTNASGQPSSNFTDAVLVSF
jgi:hypothetical protein